MEGFLQDPPKLPNSLTSTSQYISPPGSNKSLNSGLSKSFSKLGAHPQVPAVLKSRNSPVHADCRLSSPQRKPVELGLELNPGKVVPIASKGFIQDGSWVEMSRRCKV
ncbi:hypothetical protein PM082_004536 [Marasmius tenuissimus]|nr:hypothetical protein PM082_004536 [Marasmius tenuissimus]